MPRKPKANGDAQANPDPNHDHVEAGAGGAATATESEVAEEVVADPPQPPPAPEAHVGVTMRGTTSAVRNAAARIAGAVPRGQARQQQEEDDETPDDPYQQFLADPRNMVIVTREEPEIWEGQKLKPVKKKINCPTTVERVADKIFREYGGHIFRMSIHPNTPNGEAKILGALMLENPDTEEPWYPDSLPTQPVQEEVEIPAEQDDEDPLVVIEQNMHRRNRIAAQKLRQAEIMRATREAEEEAAGGRKDGSDDRVRDLERKLQETTVESRLRSEISELKALVQQLATQPHKSDGNKDQVLVAMIQSMNAQSTAMLTAMQQSTAQMIGAITAASRQKNDGDDSLEKLIKLKALTDDPKSRRFDGLMEEFMIERLFNNGGGSDSVIEEDTVKLAIKQAVPLIKDLIHTRQEEAKRLAQPGVTQEQLQKIAEDAKKNAVNEFFEKMKREGKLIPLPAPHPAAPPATPQPPQAAPAPTPAPKHEEEEEEDVNLPPSPQSPKYDRKLAVNFVLATIIADIQNGCPDDSYAAGDCLDRLDDEILTNLTQIGTAEDLEKLFAPFADSAKMAFIKETGKRPEVADWLKKIVNTVRATYIEELRQAAAPKK